MKTNTETPRASVALAEILANRGLTATAFAELSSVGDVSLISRDVNYQRSITPRRMRAYLGALSEHDARHLAAEYLADLLGSHAEIITGRARGGGKVAESGAEYLAAGVPAAARRALAALAEASKDLQVAEWLAASAAILGPRAVPESNKKQDKRRKNEYG